jgi:hypothetical protein
VSEPVIVLTDTPPVLQDRRCPTCGSVPELRQRSHTFGPVHDVCGWCRHNFDELTVPETPEDGDECAR